MRRRDFIAFAAALVWKARAGDAQAAPKRPLVGFLGSASATALDRLSDAFRNGLRERGYIEGQTIDIAWRFAATRLDELPQIARELVSLGPDVIVATILPAVVAVKDAAPNLPVVCPALNEAVRLGLIESFAHPGGNVTGISTRVDGLAGKQVQLAREAASGAGTIGLLVDDTNISSTNQRDEMQQAGGALGIKVIAAVARTTDDLAAAFSRLRADGAGAVVVTQDSLMMTERERIAELAAALRIPAVYGFREHVEAGGLISYGVSLHENFRRAAAFVDEILKGARPGDLPVEFPTKLELIVNLKAARALGLDMPASLLARADEVIE